MICFWSFKLFRQDETLSKHGPRSNPWSEVLYSFIIGVKVSPVYDQHRTSTITLVNLDYGMAYVSQTSVDSSAHSLVHFGQRRLTASKAAARASCRTLLTSVISFSAHRQSLRNPTGGAKINLSIVINKRTDDCDKNIRRDLYQLLQPLAIHARPETNINFLHQRCNPNLKLGISERRCAYFTVMMGSAPPIKITLKLLQTKPETSHRSTNINRPTGNVRYTPLQIITEDIKKTLRTFSLESTGNRMALRHCTSSTYSLTRQGPWL